MPPKTTSLIPNPEELQAFKSIDERFPVMVIQLADRVDKRNSDYAITGMICGFLSLLFVIGTAAYLVMHGKTVPAALLGAGVLGVIAIMIRARLQSDDKSKTH